MLVFMFFAVLYLLATVLQYEECILSVSLQLLLERKAQFIF